jgi:hypothetical protein
MERKAVGKDDMSVVVPVTEDSSLLFWEMGGMR